MSLFSGESIFYLNDKRIITPKGRPIIFANTHKFKPDMEKITLSISKPSVILASDFYNSYKTISGWYFGMRPTIFIDPYSKEDRKYTYKMLLRYLKEGHDCMIFPEAVWNLSENKIVLETFLGTVRAALESNAVIVCTAIERYEKKYVINRKGYLDPTELVSEYTNQDFTTFCNYPKKSELLKNILIECNRVLIDTLATRTFEIWENHAKKYGVESRASLPSDYWQQFIAELTAEWPGYKMSDNVEQRFHSKEEREQQQIRVDLQSIQLKNNAFLFDKRYHF